jgi:hypothetical protein
MKKFESRLLFEAAQAEKKRAATEFTDIYQVILAFNLEYNEDRTMWEQKHFWDIESLLETRNFVEGPGIGELLHGSY